MEEISIKLQVFEGPLDLLLFLIDKNKVNIYDIPIVEITDQYMEYLDQMEKSDLDLLSEFLVMAAELVDIKCRMLLPPDPDEEEEEQEDPRADLVKQLLEYKMYKYMAGELKDRSITAGMKMFRAPDIPKEVLKYEEPVDLEKLTAGLDLEKLNQIFQQVLKRQADKTDPVRSKFGKIEREEVSLEDKMDSLTSYARAHRHFSFRSLLNRQSSRVQVIVTFLALLELMKVGKLTVVQENLFDDIEITSVCTDEEDGTQDTADDGQAGYDVGKQMTQDPADNGLDGNDDGKQMTQDPADNGHDGNAVSAGGREEPNE